MASIVKLSRAKQPPRAIDFQGLNGKRCRLRIGKVKLSEAREFKAGIERLLTARRLNQSIDNQAADWLAGVDHDIREKMARFGLCRSRVAVPTLDVLIDGFLARKKQNVKPASLERLGDTMTLLKKHVLTNLKADKITPAIAQDFRSRLQSAKLADATVRTHIRNCKTLFNDAIDREILTKNPFRNCSQHRWPLKKTDTSHRTKRNG